MTGTLDAAAIDRAVAFVYGHGRLLERRLMELELGRAPSDVGAAAVLDALDAYRNDDGGLGQALEPDVRAPSSQPLFVDFGLSVLDDAMRIGGAAIADRARGLAVGVVRYLETVTDGDGGVPIVTADVAAHDRAAHWGDGVFPTGLNPTANITVRLRRMGAAGEWTDRADAFCRAAIDAAVDGGAVGGHTLDNVLRFLAAAPDREWADDRSRRVAARTADMPHLNLRPSADYGVSPLDIAPDPGDPSRRLFPADGVAAHLDALVEAQRPDGGWPLSWSPPPGAATDEWRGVVTVRALSTLIRNGRAG